MEGALMDAADEEEAQPLAAAAAAATTPSKARRGLPLDSFVTVHAALSGGDGGGARAPRVALSAHACAMPLTAWALPPAPVTLEVRGEGRRDPEVKHSKWLWDRQELERYKVGAGGRWPCPGRCLAGGGSCWRAW